jgi:aspartate kinase
MESDMVKILRVIRELGESRPDIKPIVASGNSKITLSGDEMRVTPGVYARALTALSNAGGELIQVTTSETEVSLLVPAHDLDAAYAALSEEFKIN